MNNYRYFTPRKTNRHLLFRIPIPYYRVSKNNVVEKYSYFSNRWRHAPLNTLMTFELDYNWIEITEEEFKLNVML